MKIVDLNGCTIEVTDLEKAIAMCEEFSHYKHEDGNYTDFEKRRKAYWVDMHSKLSAMGTQEKETTK